MSFGIKTIKFVISITLFGAIVSCGNEDSPFNQTEDLIVDFSFTPQEVLIDSIIQFNNESRGIDSNTSHEWDFGDDNTSSEKSPSHKYTNLGEFVVRLTENNGSQINTVSKLVVTSLSDEIQGRNGLIEALNNQGNKILVCAHRAFHKNAPENSIAAINSAIDYEIGMVEIDVRLSKDGELILMHDATVNRTTNGVGKITDLTFEQLKQFKLLDQYNNFTNENIPSLKEALLTSRGKIFIDLDVKIENYSKVYGVIKQYGMLSQVMFTIDNVTVGKTLIDLNNRSIIFPIVKSQSDYNTYIDSNLNISVMQFNSTALKDNVLVEIARNSDISIFGNIYINTTTTPETDKFSQVDNFINLGGSIIQTDYPLLVKSYLKYNNLN